MRALAENQNPYKTIVDLLVTYGAANVPIHGMRNPTNAVATRTGQPCGVPIMEHDEDASALPIRMPVEEEPDAETLEVADKQREARAQGDSTRRGAGELQRTQGHRRLRSARCWVTSSSRWSPTARRSACGLSLCSRSTLPTSAPKCGYLGADPGWMCHRWRLGRMDRAHLHVHRGGARRAGASASVDDNAAAVV